jgi:YHS domain-containing protein
VDEPLEGRRSVRSDQLLKLSATVLGLSMSYVALAQAAGDEGKLPECPVMGETVDFNVKVMTPDGPVYFCCPPCVKKYERDPAKFADKIKAQRERLAKTPRIQVRCPVSGEAVDGKTTAEIGGQKIAFCCKNCVAKYEKDPDAYQGKLADSYTYQTRCPVTGNKIDPAAHGDLPTGERIYYCCKACEPKLVKDPARYRDKLAEQGINIDPKAIAAKAGGGK